MRDLGLEDHMTSIRIPQVTNRRQPIRPQGRRRAPVQMAAREIFTGSPQISRPHLRQAHALTAIGFVQQTCVAPRKRGGRPRAFEERLIEAAKHDLRQALDSKRPLVATKVGCLARHGFFAPKWCRYR
jgi:hypothetical protein